MDTFPKHNTDKGGGAGGAGGEGVGRGCNTDPLFVFQVSAYIIFFLLEISFDAPKAGSGDLPGGADRSGKDIILGCLLSISTTTTTESRL